MHDFALVPSRGVQHGQSGIRLARVTSECWLSAAPSHSGVICSSRIGSAAVGLSQGGE
jgi:hypothetical protein